MLVLLPGEKRNGTTRPRASRGSGGIVPSPSVIATSTFLTWWWLAGAAAPVSSAQFTGGVNLVEVYATVTDSRGEPVQGLRPADFVVREDGMPQTVSVFVAERLPLALAICLDRSFSMAGPMLTGAVSASRTLLSELQPSDAVMVLGIGSEVEVWAPLSTNHEAARAALGHVDPWGTTPLFDATIAAVEAIQAAKGRRALVLLSDGADRFSARPAADAVALARRFDVLIYPVALGRHRPPVFAELASVTGARSVHVPDTRALPPALSAIVRELHSQYLLGYTPSKPASADGGWRTIQVSVTRPDLRVRARDGYMSR